MPRQTGLPDGLSLPLHLYRGAGGGHLKRWLGVASIAQLPLGMVFPFTQVFAYQIKGANEFVLGAMVAGSALASIALAIPLGRLADRIGRKKILFITIPLFWLSNLMLILAPSPVFLVIAGILQGFYFIGASIAAAIERELVPPEQMGRWIGINRFFKMLLGAFLALTAGDHLGQGRTAIRLHPLRGHRPSDPNAAAGQHSGNPAQPLQALINRGTSPLFPKGVKLLSCARRIPV
ncbi:MAG: MFS transporter [Pseudomonadota bacterium]